MPLPPPLKRYPLYYTILACSLAATKRPRIVHQAILYDWAVGQGSKGQCLELLTNIWIKPVIDGGGGE